MHRALSTFVAYISATWSEPPLAKVTVLAPGHLAFVLVSANIEVTRHGFRRPGRTPQPSRHASSPSRLGSLLVAVLRRKFEYAEIAAGVGRTHRVTRALPGSFSPRALPPAIAVSQNLPNSCRHAPPGNRNAARIPPTLATSTLPRFGSVDHGGAMEAPVPWPPGAAAPELGCGPESVSPWDTGFRPMFWRRLCALLGPWFLRPL